MQQKKLLLDVKGKELEEGRKSLQTILDRKNKLQTRVKTLEEQLATIDLKRRQAAAEALNKQEALKRLTNIHNDFVGNYLKEFDALSKERDQLRQEKAALQEQLRIKEELLENYEEQIANLKRLLQDETKTEEEKEALREELERLTAARDAVQEEVQQKERELGPQTTKEKIIKILERAGIAVGVAGAIASVISLVLNFLNKAGTAALGVAIRGLKWAINKTDAAVRALKGSINKTDADVKSLEEPIKDIRSQIKELGKKIALSIPGLIGTLLSLILRTGVELLKFLGHHLWLLIVALGLILLKKVRAL